MRIGLASTKCGLGPTWIGLASTNLALGLAHSVAFGRLRRSLRDVRATLVQPTRARARLPPPVLHLLRQVWIRYRCRRVATATNWRRRGLPGQCTTRSTGRSITIQLRTFQTGLPYSFCGTHVTYKETVYGKGYHFEDPQKVDGEPTESAPTPWTGRNVFYEIGSYPQICDQDATDDGRLPQQAPSPEDPKPEDRELNNFGHLPYRLWCRI